VKSGDWGRGLRFCGLTDWGAQSSEAITDYADLCITVMAGSDMVQKYPKLGQVDAVVGDVGIGGRRSAYSIVRDLGQGWSRTGGSERRKQVTPGFRGAMTPEQRSSEAAFRCFTAESAVSTEEGGTPMKVTNNTDAPQLKINWKHLFLAALHMSALVLSLSTHKVWTAELASRALP